MNYANTIYSSGDFYKGYDPVALKVADIDAAVEILKNAKRPVIYAGFGTIGHGELVQELSRKLKTPVLVTAKSYEAFDYDFEGLMGSAGHVAWKSGNDVIFEADTVLFIGNNYPFSQVENFMAGVKHFIQIDSNPARLGRRHKADVAMLAAAGLAVEALLEKVEPVAESAWWNAALKDAQNWRDDMHKIETKTEGPLEAHQVYNAINKYADEDAIFSIDVGDTTQMSIRHLHMTPKNMWRT